MKTNGALLKTYRERLGLKQEEVSKHLSFGQGVISQIERDSHPNPLNYIKEMINFYDECGSKRIREKDEIGKMLIERISQLDNVTKELVYELDKNDYYAELKAELFYITKGLEDSLLKIKSLAERTTKS